jgi:hypothetical protein
MAKLPYTITICPDEPNPKQFTAMTPQLVNALRYGYDMTIDQRAYVYPAKSTDFEGRLKNLLGQSKGEHEK